MKQQSRAVFSGACTCVPLRPSAAPSQPAEGTHRVEFCVGSPERLDTLLSKIRGIQEISCLTTLPARYWLRSLMLHSFCHLKQTHRIGIVFYGCNPFGALCVASAADLES